MDHRTLKRFRSELLTLINKHGVDGWCCNTPDDVLAVYLWNSLVHLKRAVRMRDRMRRQLDSERAL